ncbi:MAG: hypothetical protein GY757_54035 [bacterium]|nr:hypothetical protein [bacterium]
MVARGIALSLCVLLLISPAAGQWNRTIVTMQRSALIAIYNSTGGDEWSGNHGWKTPPLYYDGFAMPGTEKNWYGLTFDSSGLYVETIDLSDNELDGPCPPEISWLRHLKALDLSSNRLKGTIPPGLGALEYLTSLDLHDNLLTGYIPFQLGDLANLSYLDFSSNGLTGEIPPELGLMTALFRLDISSNGLSGTIPPELGDFPELHYLSLASNLLEGSIPVELANLSELDLLDLSSNRLTYTIPPQLGNLHDLGQLYLQSNFLEGPIPAELFGKDATPESTGLYIIDFASNRLEGPIPHQITDSTGLRDYGCDFRWNKLVAPNDIVRAFINSKQKGAKWESTQTILPANITAHAASGSSIEINWNPIPYSQDGGGYRVYYSREPGGSFILFGTTATKFDSRLIFTGAVPFTPYYFKVQTVTLEHRYNPNILECGRSAAVSASTSGSDIIIAGRVTELPAESDGENYGKRGIKSDDENDGATGAAGITLIFSPLARTCTTDASGYYRFAVSPGWSGSITPSGKGINFDPAEIQFENPVITHQQGNDFTASVTPREVSGSVLSAGEGIAGVDIVFTSLNGETQTVMTDTTGAYKTIVPLGWMGTVSPSKGSLVFYPEETGYIEPGIVENLTGQNFQLGVSVSLRVSLEQDTTVLIRTYYAEIDLEAIIIEPSITVDSFVILRKEPGGSYEILQEVSNFPQPYRLTHIDRHLEQGKSYTYKGGALNQGILIGESSEKTIL